MTNETKLLVFLIQLFLWYVIVIIGDIQGWSIAYDCNITLMIHFTLIISIVLYKDYIISIMNKLEE